MTNGDQQGTWVNLKSGGKVLRLWETGGGPDQHHIALLWLPDARYKQFTKDPIKFLIDNNIFYTDKLKEIVGESTVIPKSKNLGVEWMVMVDHDWNICNSEFASMQLFKPPEKLP